MHSSDALYLFNEGRNFQAYRLLGAHPAEGGTVFRVWAPNAGRVSVVGDFNGWRGGVDMLHPLGIVGRLGDDGRGSAARQPLPLRNRQSPQRRQADQVRPLWARLRTASRFRRLCRGAFAARLGRRRLADQACGMGLAARAGQYLRTASRLLDAPSGRQALPVAGTGRAPGALCRRAGLHPPRTAAGHRAPARRILGLPDHRLFRADLALRFAGRPAFLHRHLSPGRSRRHPRLGARAFSAGSLGARQVRRHRALRTRRPAPRPACRLGNPHLQLRPPRGTQLFVLVRLLVARRIPFRRPARRRRRLDALPRLLAQGGRVAAQQVRRTGKSRCRRFPQGSQHDGARRVSRRADHRRGIDRLADGLAADLRRRPRLLDEMEHGLDERHACATSTATRSIAAGTTTN